MDIRDNKKLDEEEIKISKHYLNIRYRLITGPAILPKKTMTEHYLFTSWKRKKTGGIICANQELITEKKKIFKKVITSIGAKFLKGNNILNYSLPVSIFKKE